MFNGNVNIFFPEALMLKGLRMKTHFFLRKFMKQIGFLVNCFVVCAFNFSFAATEGNYTNPNPALTKIDADWRAMYGSPVHDAILVFNKMSGGTANDVSKDSLCIMRFGMAGSTTATIKNLMKYQQWAGVAGWGVSSTYRISPDGSKIAMQNGTAVSVCDTNGSNLAIIQRVSLNADQLNVSWDDSASIRRIVYSAGFIILRTVVNSDNSAGKTDTLWSHSGKDPAAGSSASVYTSVNKVGHYLSFDMPTNLANVPVVVDLVTKTAKSPTNGADGCQVRMLQDGLGTVSYHPSTHLCAANVWRWGQNENVNTTLLKVPCPNGTIGSADNPSTDCGNNMFYWCDSDTNYMVQTGDNQASASPGCYTKAFIRKGKTSNNMMYVGDFVGFPALWINPNMSTKTYNNRITANPDAKVVIKRMGNELTLVNFENRVVDDAVLTTLNGTVVAIGQKISPDQRLFSIGKIPSGSYVVSWHSANTASARFVTITR